MSYMNHGYNDSPVIHGEANAALTAPAMKAFALNASGKVILPATPGDFAVGIALANTDDVAAGGRIDLQIKDGCYAIVGENVKRGDLLSCYTDGTLKKALPGHHVLAVAIQDASSGMPVEVFITRSVLPQTAASLSMSLKDLSDVDSELSPSDGQILKYDGTEHVFKAAADATE